MLCDVVRRRRRRRRRRRWAHAPVIHAASHFDHKKKVAWVPISMHTCGSFFYNYGAPLGGPSGRRSPAINTTGKTLVFFSETKLMHLTTKLRAIPAGPSLHISNNCSTTL